MSTLTIHFCEGNRKNVTQEMFLLSRAVPMGSRGNKTCVYMTEGKRIHMTAFFAIFNKGDFVTSCLVTYTPNLF